MKVVLKSPSKSYEYYNTYTVTIDNTNTADVRVIATVYKINDIDLYDTEIRETEVDFYVNGKPTMYGGFKELYTKLYGIKVYDEMLEQVTSAAEEKFIAELDHPNIIQQLDSATAKKYIKKLLKIKDKYRISSTTMRKKDNEFNVWYTSNYIIKQLAKIIDKKLVEKHNCVPTTGNTNNPCTHEIAIIQSIIDNKTIQKSTIK